MNVSLLTAKNLFFIREAKTILYDIALDIDAGHLVTMVGPNGSGKSTLLKVLIGLLPLTSGTIQKNPNLRVGYMPQKLFIDKTLPLNVETFLRLSPYSKNWLECLKRVGMGYSRHALMHDLSGGEFQRVLLAKALLREPNLLVLDEPVQGVDIVGQAEIYRLIQDIRDTEQCGIFLVSHDLHFVHRASDHVICLNKHICCQGRPEDVQKNPDYISLFGHPVTTGLALYTHSHSHTHEHSLHETPLGTSTRETLL